MIDNKAFEILSQEKGGFDFSLYSRNDRFNTETKQKLPNVRKTGTTICGVVYNDGVVIAADTRATSGSIVCDKNCEKIHYISKLIWCCGAGTSADTENTTALISSKMKLQQLATNEEPRVVAAMTQLKQHLFGYQGYVSAALVLGGVDVTGSYLYTVHPHGSVDRLPYVSMGSGSLAAMAVLEAGYTDDQTEEKAIDLVTNAIQAGIFNDLGSGSNVDVCVISNTKKQATMKRTHLSPIEPIPRKHTGYNFPSSTTEYLREVKKLFKDSVLVNTVSQSNVSTDTMTD